MNRERRRHRRFNISHPAELWVTDRKLCQVHISNFSRGGFSLSIGGDKLESLRAGGQSNTEHPLEAEVRLQGETSEHLYRIPVRITFASEHGVGVAFMQPDRQVLEYLSEYLRKAVSDRQDSSLEPLHTPCGQLTRFLEGRFDVFLALIEETFLSLEGEASLQAQPALRHARNGILADPDALKRRFLQQVDDTWKQIGAPSSSDDSQQYGEESLELVDREAFDEWALVVAMARRQESRLSHTLFELSQAFAHLIRAPVSNESNPLSPYSLLWALKRSLEPLSLERAAREVVYRVFCEQVLAVIDPLYREIYQQLEEKRQPSVLSAEPSSENQFTPLDDNAATGLQRPKPRSLVETLSGFLERRKESNTQTSRQKVSSNAAVVHALDHMVQGDQRNLADRVEQALSGPGAEGAIELSDESRQIIDATEQLLRVAQQDPRHNSTLRRILRQVQLPLAKAAINDPAVLNDPQHASKRLLDNLDQLALLTTQGDSSLLSRRLDEQLQGVLESLEMAGGRADLEQVSQQVSELLEERRNAFNNNLRQVVNGYQAEQQTIEASHQIRRFLEQQVSGSVSLLVDRLLRSGWAGLMVQMAAGGEEKERVLQGYQRVLSMIHEAFCPEARNSYLKPEKWQKVEKVLRSGFKVYNLYQAQSELLIRSIGEALQPGSESHELYINRRVEVNAGYLDQLLPATSKPETNEPDETLEQEIAPLLRVDLERLQEGDWLIEQQQQGRVRVINLALYDRDLDRYLFVDGNGVKTFQCGHTQLLQWVQAGRLAFIEGGSLPLVERAVESALKQSFEQLREESDLDGITGLANRRALMRELGRLVEDSGERGTVHTLVCMDVDNFSLLNDLYGNEGGDHFLASLGSLCQSFTTRDGLLARTGDSEFGLVWRSCSIAEGFRFAENLRKAIEQFHYRWGGEQFSVTVSIGLVEVNQDTRKADELFNAAHSACAEARQEGRNRCVCYQSDEAVFTRRRKLVESVPRIEKALAEDRLELYAQLIQPVFLGDGLQEHHEILLRPLDSNRQPDDPQDFILAAEQFERMRAVDRWVVQRFFAWAKDALKNADVQSVGGFSINLSAQSMGDERFAPFLREQLRNAPLPPERIAFEITETAMVNQFDNVRRLMQELKSLGCQFYLDDFGSGYATYSYLRNMPVDVVKIDGVFVREIDRDEVSFAMVKSITEVAHRMDKLVIAEYVESEAILNALRKIEVDFAQGYAVGRPAPLRHFDLNRPLV